MLPYNQSLQLTLDPAKTFATAKPASVSSAAELRRFVSNPVIARGCNE